MRPRRDLDHELVLEAVQLDRDLREDVLAHDDERGVEAPRDDERDVGDDGRVGHAEHDVGRRRRQSGAQRAEEIRRVVERPQGERAPVEGGRRHADDLDAFVLLSRHPIRLALQLSGHDRDLEVGGERRAQLGEQMRRRLDARPVVLVEHEQAGSAHAETALGPSAAPRNAHIQTVRVAVFPTA